MPAKAPPPPAKGMSPQDYYGALTSQGFRPWEAYQAVQTNFGPPKSPQQIAEEQASAEQNAALAQTGGQVLGTVGTAYGLGQIGAGAGTAGAGASGAGAIGAGGAYSGGVGGMAGVGGTAGAGTAGAGTASTGATLSGAGAVALPVALAIGMGSTMWESGMKDILRGRGDRSDWINQGVNLTTGFLPNMALNLMGKRSVGKMMTTGKSDAQLLRDDFRGKLQETGVADKDYNIILANGDKYNIGKDGKAKLTNIDGKTTRRTWDVDWENPLAKYAVDKIDPRVRSIYTEEAAKAGIPVEQYTGMLVNAATYNAKTEKDVEANINAMLGKSGLDKGPGATISKKPEAPIAVRPPAPLPPGVKPGPIEAPKKKQSMGDILRFNINKQEDYD